MTHIQLHPDPIVEAIFEIRFEPNDPNVSDALGGLLLSKLRSEYPKFERLPAADLPRQFRRLDPELAFRPLQRLVGSDATVSLGDKVFVISANAPYPGWNRFRPKIVQALNALEETGVVKLVSRFSVKYVNLLQGNGLPEQYAMVKFSGQLGNTKLTNALSVIRAEFDQGGYRNIVEMSPNSFVANVADGTKMDGLLLSVDTIALNIDTTIANILSKIDDCHSVEKEIFFGAISEHAKTIYRPKE